MNTNTLEKNSLTVFLILCSIAIYVFFSYYLERTQYMKLSVLYFSLFSIFYYLVLKFKNNIKWLFYISFGFRGLFILAIPNLSQDFYRFIWDGRMILEGFNPYLHNVESFIAIKSIPVEQGYELYRGMGALNASHFTNYPPLNQICFLIAGLFAGKSILGSVVVMRFLIIAADFGTFYFGKRLLNTLNLPVHNIFWYILNPFIIIELTGNLHFEGVMIFFLVWSLYLLQKGKWFWAAVVLALSISVKLIPLIFLPIFFQWFMKHSDTSINNIATSSITNAYKGNLNYNNILKNIGKLLLFYVTVIGFTIVLFLPFYSPQFINNYTETVGLWFKNFEFNASLYYIAREIGYSFRGYNEIAIIGKYIPIIVIVFILVVVFLRKNKNMVQLITAMLFVLSFYYFTATTVHPWYIATLLILSVFTKYRFPLIWSMVIILSYLAYLNINSMDKSENLWIIAIEYIIVYSVMFWELLIKKSMSKKKKIYHSELMSTDKLTPHDVK